MITNLNKNNETSEYHQQLSNTQITQPYRWSHIRCPCLDHYLYFERRHTHSPPSPLPSHISSCQPCWLTTPRGFRWRQLLAAISMFDSSEQRFVLYRVELSSRLLMFNYLSNTYIEVLLERYTETDLQGSWLP